MKKQSIFIAVFVLTSLLLLPSLAIAADDPTGINNFKDKTSLGKKPLQESVAGIINIALGLLGLIAVVLIVIGGFIWMTAAGNEEKIATAKKLLFAALIGLVIIITAWSIANFFIGSIVNVTQ